MRLGSAVVAFLVPCAIFAGVAGSLSFATPRAGVIVAGAAMLVLALAALAGLAWRRRGALEHDPGWHVLLAAGCAMAWAAASALGSSNRQGLNLYFDMINMALYMEVDPDASGAKFVDAGRILFQEGAFVDTARAVAFRESRTYCVAPIALRKDADVTSTEHDFWAAGVDCCDGNGANFTCGDVLNRRAYAGMRLLDSDRRPFYRLAVQQAEAKFGLTAGRPMFFDWMHDPIGELASSWDAVGHRLLVQVLGFAVVQFFVVAAASVVLARPKDEKEED